MLAPLAGIGNWFVRLQAKRYGAGLAVSEMVSSFGVHYGNEKTCVEMLRIHPDERSGDRGPVSIQLFGQDPEIMRSAAATVAERGADLIDLNMGCPVPKVCKTGAGAALIEDPDTAVAVARAAREGSGLPGHREAALRPASRGRPTATRSPTASWTRPASARSASTRASAAVHHKGVPDYDLAAKLVASLAAPVILSGGLLRPPTRSLRRLRAHRRRRGHARPRLARQPVAVRAASWAATRASPTPDEVLGELDWVMDRAAEHLGPERAARYLRKFYPWYLRPDRRRGRCSRPSSRRPR